MTAPQVLQMITAVHAKQTFKQKPIGLDTLSLMLKVEAIVLLPLIDELQTTGKIICYPSKSALGKRGPVKYGTVSIISLPSES